MEKTTIEAVPSADGLTRFVPGDSQKKGEDRVLRGGSWINNGRNVRSAYRNRNTPDNRNDNIGLRLAQAQLMPEGNE